MTLIKEEVLTNGLSLVFSDESNRYFGDYHRICVVATLSCDLQGVVADNAAEELFWNHARSVLGDQLNVTRRLERMGVPSAKVDETRLSLIEDFMRHTAPYMGKAVYLRSLAEAEMSKRRTRRTYAL